MKNTVLTPEGIEFEIDYDVPTSGVKQGYSTVATSNGIMFESDGYLYNMSFTAEIQCVVKKVGG